MLNYNQLQQVFIAFASHRQLNQRCVMLLVLNNENAVINRQPGFHQAPEVNAAP